LPLRLSYWVDLALVAIAVTAVSMIREPVKRSAHPRMRVQAVGVPREMRATFVTASLAGFAGFAVLGLSTAVSPAFLSQELGVKSLAVVGLVVFGVLAASTAGQLLLEVVREAWAMPAGCGALIGGMALFAVGLASSSLPLVVIGGMLAGAGQGLSFRSALGRLNAEASPQQRVQVASSFFVVAYIAISIPVIGEGVLAEIAGLRTAGLVFAGVVAAIAAVVLLLLARYRRESPAQQAG